jgi:zinc/manganese transport system substrate-binding protein
MVIGLIMLMACNAASAAESPASAKLRVVASFSILADFVRNVGGDRVEVATLVPAGSDAHVYSPTSADLKTIAAAKLMVVNGLGFEGWLERLATAAGPGLTIVTATAGIVPRKARGAHDAGDDDPHAWQSVDNAKVYVGNILKALVATDPEGAAAYRDNADRYLARLDTLDQQVRAMVAEIPAAHRKVISTHDAFGYFADAYGINFIAPQGVSTDSEPNARDIAKIINQIKADRIPAVFMETVSDPRLIRQIANETGAKLGGTLFSDTLTDEKGDAPTYIDMVLHNIKTLSGALAR